MGCDGSESERLVALDAGTEPASNETADSELDVRAPVAVPEEVDSAEPDAADDVVDYLTFTGAQARHLRAQVEGRAEVVRVFSDRALYLESDAGGDVLAIVREDEPEPEMIDIDKGQRLEFRARVLGRDDSLPGELQADAKLTIQKEPAFLSMHWREVTILPDEEGEKPSTRAFELRR